MRRHLKAACLLFQVAAAFAGEPPAPGKVRAILASIPPGSDYPAQLEQIVGLGKEAVPPLTAVFEDAAAPWQSRWIAGMALGRFRTDEARRSLEKGLADPLFLVRMASVQALSRSGDPSVAASLRKALSDPALVVRSAAVESLERLDDRAAVPDLLAELGASRNFHRGRSLWIREQIVRTLGTLGSAAAVPTLLAVLKESEANLRLSACSALSRIEPQAAAAGLRLEGESCVEEWSRWGVNRK